MTKLKNLSHLSRRQSLPADAISNGGGDASKIGLSREMPSTPYGGSDDDLLDPREMAADLHCSKSYLDKLRCYGGGPPYIRLGPRKILYRRGDGRGWAAARRFDSTSQYKK